MHIIKKYANRKLYHTNRKQYITLDGIAELIQAGEAVQVVDNETGEDITASILSQVVLLARGKGAPLPTSILTNLIQTGSDKISGLSRSVLTLLGGMSVVDAEIRQRLDHLEEHGDLSAPEAERMRRLLLHNAPPAAEAEIPSAGDIARLSAQVDALTSVVDQLLHERTTPAERKS